MKVRGRQRLTAHQQRHTQPSDAQHAASKNTAAPELKLLHSAGEIDIDSEEAEMYSDSRDAAMPPTGPK